MVDDPNVSDEIGREIAEIVVEHLRKKKDLALAQPVIAHFKTRWATVFGDAVVSEYLKSDVINRGHLGFITSSLAIATSPDYETELVDWLAKRVEELRNTDERIVARAALGLMRVAFEGKATIVPGMVETLLDLLSGRDQIASAAAWALGWLRLGEKQEQANLDEGKPHWRPLPSQLANLVEFISQPGADAEAVRFASWVLREERVEAAVQPLIARLSDPHAPLRKDAAVALGEIGDDRGIDALLQCLEDQDAEVRGAVIAALGKFDDERLTEALLTLLNHDDAQTRQAALGALANKLEEVDRKLLSRDLDGLSPFLDPKEAIHKKQIVQAASTLSLALDEVQRRCEILAEKFGLKLEISRE